MSKAYDNHPLAQLEDWEFVRKRPGMFFGGTDERGVRHMVEELIDNAVDQYLAGHATQVGVRLDGQAIEVWDDGKGYPFGKKLADGTPFVEVCWTRFHNSATFDGHAPHIHGGLHGVGVAAVCAACDEVTIESWHEGNLWRQQFRRGRVVTQPERVESGSGRGTSVRIMIDDTIMSSRLPDWSKVESRASEIAHLFPGLMVHCGKDTYHAPQGMLDFAITKATKHSLGIDPSFNALGILDDVEIYAAAVGRTKGETRFYTWANGVPTRSGGSHAHGLKRALKRNV